MATNLQPSIALVYDRANTPYGGAENVLLALHQAFPKAPLYTSLSSSTHAPWIQKFPQVITSKLNKLAILRTKHRWLAFLMPMIFESFDLSKFDVIISVTSAEAKGVITRPNQLHICYLLTPPRYLYQNKKQSLASHWLLRLPLIKHLARILINYLTWWDQAAIFRPDLVIPISQLVTKRVKQFYPAIHPEPVIYPPINLQPKFLSKQRSMTGLTDYLLVISRLVAYKKIELAIEAAGKLGKNLIIVGQGPEQNRLKRLALAQTKSKILFFNQVDQDQLANLYQHCQALIMPGIEDFGIVALEANSFGKPVIINTKSGAAELIRPNVHGVHIQATNLTATVQAIQKLEKIKFSIAEIEQNPLQYDTNMFINKFVAVIQSHQQQTK
ncbi:MAG: hypothetical protein A2383_00170 [Candidatus Pacebacteria bacterium RIFOXYB1_FULL_39_46]|nr:MAG: hypothetical protein A2383_00170 [Candidatus Pacebacteria bacterium RIFOXYB1_FULL_39_46]OGJ38837.1 MAG: hypothetical protein A2182_02570 [Candidatus Pacebacteria bacterium RIFOXYA1_FULL_38_18]OGJ40830.1 MAG: hypothetical protein A2411_00900 [Candidatus Pacebacteria bacterium RIFOXYC1_FULL_39_21]